MSYGPYTYYSLDLKSGACLTTNHIDLGRAFKKVYLEVPTMASGSLYVQAAADSSLTFRRVCQERDNTSSAHIDFTINSASTQRIIPIPAGFRFYKVESSSGATDVTTTFRFITSD